MPPQLLALLANNNFQGGLTNFLSGAMGGSAGPYHEFMDWQKKAAEKQNPFYNSGTQGLGNFQEWLGSMKDPSQFINNLMGKYYQSPWAKNMIQQSNNAGTNAASASGLTGSTPFAQQLQQNAGNISSQDQNNWLQNVLGINTQYGAGQQSLANMGQSSANTLGDIYNRIGEGAYGARAGENQDRNNMMSGFLKMFT